MTRKRIAALVGNPNAGKSALFNALTGARQKIANYPGVTVERKAGRLTLPSGEPLELIDLPAGWDIGIWNRFWDFKISQLVVEPAEDTPGQRPRLRVDVPDDVLPGDYSFTLLVTSPSGKIEYDRATFTITVPSEVIEEDDSEVSVTTDFPSTTRRATTNAARR